MVPIRRGLLVTTSSWLLLVLRAVQAQTPEFSLPPSSLRPNYGRIGIGQREAIEAGAYVARTDDSLANWYNPAGLAMSRKTALASSSAYDLTTTLSGICQKSSANTAIAGRGDSLASSWVNRSPAIHAGDLVSRSSAGGLVTEQPGGRPFNLPAGGRRPSSRPPPNPATR